MAVLWPGFLILLGLIPLLVAVYWWWLRRRRRYVVRYSSLSLVREALPRYAWWRRHLPFVLFLLALTSLVLALVRPVTIVSVPSGQTTILMAIDVSLSMCGTDIRPNRLESAKAAALEFVRTQAATAQLGLVAFAGFAQIVQSPTDDQEVMEDAIISLSPGRRTAIGSAILKSLDAIAEIDPNVAPSDADPAETEVVPVVPGAYAPAIIVLLTDGVSNYGPFPLEAAQQAVARGVRVYTIGFGTEAENTPFGGPGCEFTENFGGGFFGGPGFGGGGGGGGFRRGIDEDTLRQVSEMTGGEYYAATSAGELQSVFQSLPTSLITKHETTEISVVFAALGALLAALAVMLSQLWSPLP